LIFKENNMSNQHPPYMQRQQYDPSSNNNSTEVTNLQKTLSTSLYRAPTNGISMLLTGDAHLQPQQEHRSRAYSGDANNIPRPQSNEPPTQTHREKLRPGSATRPEPNQPIQPLRGKNNNGNQLGH
jgi:hypothetical protein